MLIACGIACSTPLQLLAEAPETETARGDGVCRFILKDYELSKTTEDRINYVVTDLLKRLQAALDFTGTTNLHVRVRIFERFEDFETYAKSHYNTSESSQKGSSLADLAGFYSPDAREVVVWAQKDHSFFGNSILHECTHAILDQQFHRVPIWANEGCAVNFSFPKYMRDRSDQMMLISQWLLLKKYLDEHTLPDLKTFLNLSGEGFREMNPERAYPVSWSLVQLMLSTKERQKAMDEMLKRLQQKGAKTGDCASLLEELYPGGLAKMEQEWHQWIYRGASALRGWRLDDRPAN